MSPDDLARLHAAAFTEPRPWTAAEFAALLAAPGVFLLTAPNALLMGRTLGPGPGAEAELLTLAVHPDARRRGRARTLLACFDAEAAARGADRAFLEVMATNAPALALYRGAGWREAGRRPGYYRAPDGAPVDAVILDKALAARPATGP